MVHLHSTYATALSCRTDLDEDDCVPPLTPYVVMRVGRVKLVPYFRPGDHAGGEMIRALGGKHAAVLLANHGTIVSGPSLAATVHAAEELEETAKLIALTAGWPHRLLDAEQVADLRKTFG